MIPINTRKYYKELFAKKSMLIKLFKFLLDEDRCLAAGYKNYKHFRHGSGYYSHDVILIGYDHFEKEYLKIDVTCSDDDKPLYWLYITCQGDRPLKYIRYIIKTFCRGKETFEMKTILKFSKARCVLANMKIVTNTIISHEPDDFMLKVLENMRMLPDETQLFPTVDTDGIFKLETFTLENLYMTNKIFDAIIEGITHNI